MTLQIDRIIYNSNLENLNRTAYEMLLEQVKVNEKLRGMIKGDNNKIDKHPEHLIVSVTERR